ncbi:hypothetical protein TNCV_838531 [Trichonephila clavipes]|nr:hypothetical protein TNCV_838531 [Trichonephila clavipes]
MDDNCRPRRANLVEDFRFEEGIVRMEWPAFSPDMNPKGTFDTLYEDELLAANHPHKLSKIWKELIWKSGTECLNS